MKYFEKGLVLPDLRNQRVLLRFCTNWRGNQNAVWRHTFPSIRCHHCPSRSPILPLHYCLTPVLKEPDLQLLLTFTTPNLMSIFRCLRRPKQSAELTVCRMTSSAAACPPAAADSVLTASTSGVTCLHLQPDNPSCRGDPLTTETLHTANTAPVIWDRWANFRLLF
jgi:hypothetical protein